MSPSDANDIDLKSPPFDHFRSVRRLDPERRGHTSIEHARHQLFIGRDKRTNVSMLIKLATKPGLIYQQNIENEIATLTTVNRELTQSRYFPLLGDHGRLRDGRTYLTITLFDEFPLATTIGAERIPGKTVGNLITTLEVAKALAELHGLEIFHVDLNPMNILHRVERGRPIIRIVDFESSYERARHAKGVFYNPPTTPGFSAPEVSRQPPDARADIFSLGAVLYTMLAGYQWSMDREIGDSVRGDGEIDKEMQEILLAAVDVNPEKRYPSIAPFRAAVAAYLERIWPGRTW